MPPEPPPTPPRPPQGLRIERTADTLRITRRWLTPASLLLSPVGPFMLWIAVDRMPALSSTAGFWKGYMLPGLFVIGAVVFGYATLASLLNRTVITLTPQSTEVDVRPLPTPSLFTRKLRGGAVRTVDHRVERILRQPVRYVDATLVDGREVILLQLGGDEPAAAEFIIEAIRRYLAETENDAPGG